MNRDNRLPPEGSRAEVGELLQMLRGSSTQKHRQPGSMWRGFGTGTDIGTMPPLDGYRSRPGGYYDGMGSSYPRGAPLRGSGYGPIRTPPGGIASAYEPIPVDMEAPLPGDFRTRMYPPGIGALPPQSYRQPGGYPYGMAGTRTSPFGSAGYSAEPRPYDSTYPREKSDIPDDAMVLVKILPTLLQLADRIAAADPYTSVEQCQQVIQQVFGDVPSKDQLDFSSLLDYYRALRNTQDIPNETVVVLKTISQALQNLGHEAERTVSLEMSPQMNEAIQGLKELKSTKPTAETHGNAAFDLGRLSARGDEKAEVNSEGQARAQKRSPVSNLSKHPRFRPDELPKEVQVSCAGTKALFNLETQTINCLCPLCAQFKIFLGIPEIDMSAKCFERHCGMGHAKKWKTSIRMADSKWGPEGSIGNWLEQAGIECRYPVGKDDYLISTYGYSSRKCERAEIQEELMKLLEADPRAVELAERRRANFASQPATGKRKAEDVPSSSPEKGKSKVQREMEATEDIREMETEEKIQKLKVKIDDKHPEIIDWKMTCGDLDISIKLGNVIYKGTLTSSTVKKSEHSQPKIETIQEKMDRALDDELNALQQKEKESERVLRELAQVGPSPESTCAFCNEKILGNQEGLGAFFLVQYHASKGGTVWVHDQCAKWSPEVYDPRGDGNLNGVKDAVRRGRLIRCKVCNQRGATLGCLYRNCKWSYHLPCARKAGCALHLDPYVVACPNHIHNLPKDISEKLRSLDLKVEDMMYPTTGDEEVEKEANPEQHTSP